VESVRDAADIVRVISDYVPLKRAGTRLKGLCPFHQEKTPSFSVDADRQLFYCFGCQTGGDIFKFVMLYEKVGFPEAVEALANRFAVPMPASDRRADDPHARLLALNKAATEFFRASLTSTDGLRVRKYLEQRGLKNETVDKLSIGFAPDSWDSLSNNLRAKRYSMDEMHRGGLVLPRKSGSGFYDRFRDRLIFPIRDVMGRPVAFGGRILGDGQPKYINSPETPAYTKGQHLYGLDLARDAIRREGLAIVVEGYLDLAALVQSGFDNVVASLGTAFTPAQARLLARYTNRVLVSYDGDAAGATATARSLDMLLERAFEVRVVELPPAKDPDDFIRDQGAEAYGRQLRQAPEYLEFLIRRQVDERDLDRVDQKVAAVNAVLPHLTKLSSSIERTSWATRLADALRIEEGLVLQELRVASRAAQPRIRHRPASRNALRDAEARLVWLMLGSEKERRTCADTFDPDDLKGSAVARIVETVLELDGKGERVDYPLVLAALDDENDRELLTQIAVREEPDEGPNVEDCLCAFKRQRLTREGRAVLRELGASGESDVDDQLLRVQELAKQRESLL
jgi:DNA primase